MKVFHVISLALMLFVFSAAKAQTANSDLPMDRVYQGLIRIPDFSGRDRQFSTYRTRITNEMKTGPNFAGHYAIVEIGCGTSCRFAFVGDVATGQVFNFPYGGESYYMLSLDYKVKEKYVSVHWIGEDNSKEKYGSTRWEDEHACFRDYLTWNGKEFTSSGKVMIGPVEKCE